MTLQVGNKSRGGGRWVRMNQRPGGATQVLLLPHIRLSVLSSSASISLLPLHRGCQGSFSKCRAGNISPVTHEATPSLSPNSFTLLPLLWLIVRHAALEATLVATSQRAILELNAWKSSPGHTVVVIPSGSQCVQGCRWQQYLGSFERTIPMHMCLS